MTGPNLQNNIFDILIRFQLHSIVLSCDMKKMFLQVIVEQRDQDFQRLFWRDSEDQPLREYRLTRLVFGLTNSPFTAMCCVRQVADDIAQEDAELSNILKYDIFMDDILYDSKSIHSAIQLHERLTKTLAKYCNVFTV